MRGKRKLVKQCGGLDGVGLRERLQIGGERFGVARHINNAVKLGNQLQRCAVHACAGRVYKNGGKIVIRQRDAAFG